MYTQRTWKIKGEIYELNKNKIKREIPGYDIMRQGNPKDASELIFHWISTCGHVAYP